MWPESSTPFYFEEDRRRPPSRCAAMAREARVPILLGSDQIDGAQATTAACRTSITTPRSWCAPDGSTAGVYRKMHLVPFGEYVPLKRLLFFAAPLVEAVSDFSAGRDGRRCCRSSGHPVSTAICYEVVYPDLVRQFVRGGSELLTTITNDAWFGADVGAVPAFRAGRRCGRSRTAAIWCAPPTPASAASSIRTAGCSSAAEIFQPAVHRRRGAVPADVDGLYAPRRRVRVRLGAW